MAGRPDSKKREMMLNQACEILSRSGVVDTSLRSLAAQMGTSGRMLIYYFGSKEKLILEVIEHEQRRAAPDPGVSSSAADLRAYILADWDSITRGEKHVSVRILEQVFGAACAQESPYAHYTAQTLDRLIGNFEARLVAIGMPGDIAATRAVVGLTALQGYLMRYFTAADPAAVDRDFLRFVDDVILAPF
ncbi:TetR/AcrR family transcriptional regulator [Nocardia carnea]|uniref:TetR/AcrR family transcriptional regulator n=1 Tax=Nocardia carnea TaxID=37328 RepID=A0ABW7TJU0_9NOCA|nr:TetR/AcrR family transcriptional regulator [Nocardia carnea]